MNSVEALTYALRKLEAIKINPQRADALERAIELQQAITTLEALRDMIAERPVHTESWSHAPDCAAMRLSSADCNCIRDEPATPWRVEQQQPDGSWKPA